MRYAEIKYPDIANGLGVGVALFVQGCPFHCDGCFNEVTWDFDGGKEFTKDTLKELNDLMSGSYVERVSILGGEPLAFQNREGVYRFVKHVHTYFPDKKIWLYTGFTWEALNADITKRREPTIGKITSLCDVIVDGRFMQDQKDISLKFRGSSNQRVIDVKKSLEAKEIVLYIE